uniref:Uncharacterized protein n=1 Tax=viral metagenome TaxID=1070528 RepID=A0A6M3JEN3_9ZZZZ
MNRLDMRRRIARTVGELIWYGTSTGGTTTSLIDTTLPAGLKFRPGYVNFTKTATNYESYTPSYNEDTQTFWLSRAVASAPTTSVYEILSQDQDVYNELINDAIREARAKFLIDRVDITLTLASSTYSYTIPSSMDFIFALYHDRDGSANYDELIPDRWWSLKSSREVIVEPEVLAGHVGRKLELRGQYYHPDLSNDTTDCTIPYNYIIKWAASEILFRREALTTQAGRLNMAYTWRNDALKSISDKSENVHPNSRRVMD